MKLEQLCIIGVGLMGGSVALAAKARGICREVIGVDQNLENLLQAKELGVIDSACHGIAEGAAEAEGVVIATPVGATSKVLEALRPVWSQRAFYTDVGSTKTNVVAAAQSIFGEIPENFVPAHPIAGRELSGAKAAAAGLFSGKRVIITPLATTGVRPLEKVRCFWQALGAEVHDMSVRHHDHVLAATSHLPHVIAYALTHMLGRKDEKDEIFQYAAGGFKDFTRIASSDPLMWADICIANQQEIVAFLRQFEAELSSFGERLEQGDKQAILEFFQEAKAARQRFLDQYQTSDKNDDIH